MITPAVVFILVLITLHELGHLIMAEWFGILEGVGIYIGNPAVSITYPHPIVMVSGFLLSLLSYPYFLLIFPYSSYSFMAVEILFVSICIICASMDFTYADYESC